MSHFNVTLTIGKTTGFLKKRVAFGVFFFVLDKKAFAGAYIWAIVGVVVVRDFTMRDNFVYFKDSSWLRPLKASKCHVRQIVGFSDVLGQFHV